VREIFSMAQNGVGLTEIVRRLNQAHILPPSLYARQHGLVGNYQDVRGCWNTRTLKKLLTNCTYTGNLLQGRHQISISNTHEPIVSMEVFKAVQDRLLSKTPKATEKEAPENPLWGKVICEHCGSKMQRKRGSGQVDWYFFTCVTKNRSGSDYCTGEYIRESDIIAAIHQELSVQQSQFVASETACQKRALAIKEEIHNLEEVQAGRLQERREAYECFVSGQYTSQEYKGVISKLPSLVPQIDALKNELEKNESIRTMLQMKISAINNRNAFGAFLKEQLQKVSVSEGQVIKIIF